MLRRLSILLVSLLSAFLAAELLVRAAGLFADERALVDASPTAPDRKSPAAEADPASSPFPDVIHPYVGWVMRPGLDLQRRRKWPEIFAGGQPTDWFLAQARTNLFGFSSAIEDYRTVAPEETVIGLLGGSMAVELASVGGDALLEALVRRRPDLEGRIRLLNLAAAAYKAPQQLYVLSQMLLLGIPFDVVVNLDGFNEVTLGLANALHGHHPIFPSDTRHAGRVRHALRDLTAEEILLTVRVHDLTARSAAWMAHVRSRPLLGRSELAKAVVGVMDRRWSREKRDLDLRLQQLAVAAGDLPVAKLADPCLEEPTSCLELIARLWRRTSLQIHELTRSSGARYLHLLQPNQYLEGTKPLGDEERGRAILPKVIWSRAAEGYPLLLREAEALEAAGVRFVDLTSIFAEHPEPLYRDACCHVNHRGNQILGQRVGELVADLLAEAPH